MSQPTHPLLSLVESNRNGLKSMLTKYIDATVDSHYNLMRQNIVEMIQSGAIGPQQSYDITTFGTTLPPVAQSNTDQSSAQCSHEYSNNTLTKAQKHQNNLQNEVSLSNTESMIKQEFDDLEEDGEEIDDGNVSKCQKEICNLVRENDDNTRDDTVTGENENVSVGDDDETDIESNFDESQSQIVSNNTQIKNQNDEENVINERSVSERNMEQSNPSTSGVRSSTHKQIQAKVFGDLVQSNLNYRKSKKRKSDRVNKTEKKVKRKQSLDDEEDIDSDYNDDQANNANNAIEEEIATEFTTNPIRSNISQPNRIPKKQFDNSEHYDPVPSESIESPSDNVLLTQSPPPRLAPPPTLKEFPVNVDEWYGIIPHDCKKLRCKKQGKCQLEIMGEISNKFFIIPQAFEIFKTMDHVQVQGWLSDDEVIEFTVKDCNAAARHMSQSITKVIVGPNFERVKRLPDPGKLAEFCSSIAKQFELLNKRYRELYEIDKSIEPSFGGILYDKIIRRLGTLRQQVN